MASIASNAAVKAVGRSLSAVESVGIGRVSPQTSSIARFGSGSPVLNSSPSLGVRHASSLGPNYHQQAENVSPVMPCDHNFSAYSQIGNGKPPSRVTLSSPSMSFAPRIATPLAVIEMANKAGSFLDIASARIEDKALGIGITVTEADDFALSDNEMDLSEAELKHLQHRPAFHRRPALKLEDLPVASDYMAEVAARRAFQNGLTHASNMMYRENSAASTASSFGGFSDRSGDSCATIVPKFDGEGDVQAVRHITWDDGVTAVAIARGTKGRPRFRRPTPYPSSTQVSVMLCLQRIFLLNFGQTLLDNSGRRVGVF